jgi:signal transduction histidine kinase
VRLRGRFTLALALAALVPIALAAAVTRQVIATTYRADYQARRRTAQAAVQGEVDRLRNEVAKVEETLASHKHYLVGGLLLNLAKTSGRLEFAGEQQLKEQSGSVMHGLSLDVLTITDRGDRILCAPHAPGMTGESNHPEIRERALGSNGRTYFAREQVTREHGAETVAETVLVAEASRIAQDGPYAVAVAAGRRVPAELLLAVRGELTDARIVSAGGDVLVPAARRWAEVSSAEPIRIPLVGDAGAVVAVIEVAVSDGDLAGLVQRLTLASAGLAVVALIGVVLIGLVVARRTARDLDQLVAGSLAAARGDLDHRVPVRSEDEIGAVAAAFNFMMEDLRTSKDRLVIAERIAAWQEIARRLAHEIKNPLTPIQMAMDTLRKTWKKQHPSFGEILEESTTTVMEEADRLKHIVSEFSAFARMPKPEFQRLDLNELVRSALALYQGGAAPVEIKLEPLPEIDADKNQLNQVVLNLVENARDAIGQRGEGRMTVSTRRGEAGDRALLIVEDNGPGVPGELKDKVFAPYFTTKHAKGGTGLGLAIVHRIVSDHGGRIAVVDAPGGGARFVIELPLRNGTALLTSRI